MIYLFLPFLLFINDVFASHPLTLPGPGAGGKGGSMIAPIPGMPDFSMSEQEFNEMIEFLSKLDEKELAELEMLGRQVLTDMGINPDTLEPLSGAGAQPTPSVPMPQPAAPIQPQPQSKPEPELPSLPEISAEERARMTQVLHDIVQLLNEIRLKASSVHLYEDIMTIDPKIDSLIYYSKIITQKAHVARLFDKPFENLRKNLEAFVKALKIINDQLSADTSIIESIDDPYFILNVPDTATTEEITAAYETLKELNDPEKIRESAQSEGLSESDIKKLIKQAKINFATIQDAYDKLNDPVLRDEVDHERADIIDHLQQKRQAISGLIKQFIRKFEEFAHDKRLLAQIEEFMKKYEPHEASQRKAMQRAEEERIKEIKALSASRPVMTPGFVFEPRLKYGTPKPSSSAGLPSYTPPSLPSTSSEKPTVPSKVEEEPKKDAGKKPGDKGKKDDKDKKDKDKDKDKKDRDKRDGKKPRKPDTKAPKGWDYELAQNMQGAVKKFEPTFKELAKLNVEKKLTDLQPYMHELMVTTADDAHNAAIEEIIEKAKLEELQEFLSKAKDKLPKDIAKKGAVDPQIVRGYQVAWDPFYKQYGPTIKKLAELSKGLVSPTDAGLPLNQSRVTKHIGTMDAPLPFTKLFNITKSIAENTEKIQEMLHPELKKKKLTEAKKRD